MEFNFLDNYNPFELSEITSNEIDIVLDAAGGDIKLKDDGTNFSNFYSSWSEC